MKKIVAALVAMCILLTSSMAFAAGTSDAPKFTGEQIFRGLFLGQGDVAKLFPQIWTNELLTVANSTESKTFADDLVARVKKLDSSYLSQLEKASYSNNQLQVKAALTKGQELIDKAVKQMSGSTTTINGAQGAGQGQCATVTIVAAAAIYAAALFTTVGAVTHGVVVTAGGAVAAYLVIVGGKYFWSADMTEKEGDLQQEMFINSVVKAFN